MSAGRTCRLPATAPGDKVRPPPGGGAAAREPGLGEGGDVTGVA